jgi:tetratricopeptide (TPR) repeat protein
MASFVGREAELGRLGARFERALGGRGGVVLVTGDAGAGKSTIVRHFLDELGSRWPEARVVAAGCSEQYGADEPYQPFVEAFRGLVQGSGGVERRGFRELAKELAPYWLQAIPAVGGLLAAATSTAFELKRTFGGGAPAAAPPSEEALFFQYTELFLAAAQDAPLVLFIDDLHWADRASIALLAHLARKVADQRVLILGTYRAADVEVARHPLKQARLELERYGVVEEMVLGSLDGDALRRWAEAELGASIDPELLRWLEQRAGSNPLFFGEMLKWSVENGVAQRRGEEWALGEVPAEMDIPRSAESVIEKRLGRLDPEVYRVLEYASVEGDTFHSAVLARLLEMDELALEESLEPIGRVHRLIHLTSTLDLPNGDIASVYEFGHSLIQDVLHHGIQGKRRILLHRKVAGILEEIWTGGTSAISQRLAVHYDEGRQPDRAYAFSVEAADNARRVYAHSDAIDLLRRALRNARTDGERLDALQRLGDASQRIGRFPDARRAFADALRLADSSGSAHRALAIRLRALQVEAECGGRGAHELEGELHQLESSAVALGAATELCQILWQFRWLPGAAARGVARAEAALALTGSVGSGELSARGYLELGTAHMAFGRPADATPHFLQALRLFEEMQDQPRIGACQNHIGVTRVLCGDYPGAATAFAAAVRAHETAGDPVAAASVRNNLGALLIRLGQWELAESHLLEAVRVARRLDVGARLLHPLENLARLQDARGDWPRAQECWTRVREPAAALGYWSSEAIACCGFGMARLEQDDLEGARAALERADALLQGRGRGEWSEAHAFQHLLSAAIAAAELQPERAAELLEQAETELFRRDPYAWAHFRLRRGEILLRFSRPGARELLAGARDTLAGLGAEPLLRRAESLLDNLEAA